MHEHVFGPRLRRLGAAAVAVVALTTLGASGSARADTSLSLTTPYPSIEAQPGSNVKLSLAVTSAAPEVVDLEVGGLPDGWAATLRGGGFVIHSITSLPEDGASADLEITVPPDATAGEYPITVTARDQTGGVSEAALSVVVAEVVNAGIRLTADFPSRSGDPGTAFTYTLTVNNDTPVEALIYTHSHPDHSSGSRGLLDPAEVELGQVEIYAHERLTAGMRGNPSLGIISPLRLAYSFGWDLERGAEGLVGCHGSHLDVGHPETYLALWCDIRYSLVTKCSA